MVRRLEAVFDDQFETWYVRVPVGLPFTALARIRRYLYDTWSRELSHTSPITQGSRHEKITRALKALREGRLEQVLPNGSDMFRSTEGTGKIIVGA